MIGRGPVLHSSNRSLTGIKTYTGKRQRGIGPYLRLCLVCIMITPNLIYGCSQTGKGLQIRILSREASDLFNQGKYEASLSKYKQIIEKNPSSTDRFLFEMGIIYAHPGNEQKDYQKSMECFQKIVRDYPDSKFRRDSQMMIFQIHNVINKDRIIAAQQTRIETFRQEVKNKENMIYTLRAENEELEHKIFALKMGPADKVLVEKKARRLTLLSNGEVIKTYKIALGRNPVGPKERQGDNKTPEGIYIIDSRNRNSDYHLSLHISYPNEIDIKRARERGISPGGDIMIHGLKNGFSWIGASHTEDDWTNGCIAVTNQEMEEIYKFVPDGTIVEIRP